MNLSVTVKEEKPGFVTIAPVGAIDSRTYMDMENEIDQVLQRPLKTLILDMEGVVFISSAGVGVITKAKTSLVNKNADIAMINLQPQIKKVFEIIRLVPVLNVFESVEELDDYLEKVQVKIMEEA